MIICTSCLPSVAHQQQKQTHLQTCSDNYRPIALAPTLSKNLEWCILLYAWRLFLQLTSSNLLCTLACQLHVHAPSYLKMSSVATHCFYGSNVFGYFLNASIVFNQFSHLKFFGKLLEKNLPPTIIRLLFSWYRDQISSVLWNKTLSENFSVSNGVS